MANSFDYNSTIGSWSSHETSSSNRGGWNADGSNKNGSVFDDGTAIWGNPTTKKTGVDWTEKEFLLNPPQAQLNNSSSGNNIESSKRLQKIEPIISSINGTEAWGAPVRSPPAVIQQQLQLNSQLQQQQQHHQQQQQSQHLDSAAAAAALSSVAATPSRDLLKQMVHQIHLAVQAGHLNAHILNQPMSTPTLQLVYQLLQQIKTLHQLQEIQQRAGISNTDSLGSPPTNMDLQINRIRQNISLLQKAITQQQQQTALTKNVSTTIGDSPPPPPPIQPPTQTPSSLTTAAAAAAAAAAANIKQQQQQANNYSYATISKLSTNLKVPSPSNNSITTTSTTSTTTTNNTINNMSNIISNNNNSNIDSFRRSSLIDTLSNSNSDSLRSAQANFDANAAIDKTLSSLIQASSANNILGRNKTITTSGDFSKAQQSFTGSGNLSQQPQSKGLLSSAQSPSSLSSTSSSAWSAFSSGDFVTQQHQQQQQQQGWPSHLRISSNVSQDHDPLYSAFDHMPDLHIRPAWRGPSILSDNHGKDSSTMAPGGGNIITARPNSASNSLKQHLNENDILSSNSNSSSSNNRDSSSLFCDWGNNSDVVKRNFDSISNASSPFSSSSSSAIGGLSLQSTPHWMFAAPNSSALNIGGGVGVGSGLVSSLNKNHNSIIGNGNNGSGNGGNLNNLSNILDYGNNDKMAGDSLFRSTSSALYDWSDLTSQTLQLSADNNHWGSKQQSCSSSTSTGPGGIGGHPAPPPGL